MVRKTTDAGSLLNAELVRLVIAGCLAIVVALVFMSLTTVVIARNAVLDKLKTSDLKNAASSIAAVIEGRIARAVDASLLMASDPVFLQWVEGTEQDEALKSLVQTKMAKLVEDFGYDTAFLVSDLTHNYWSFHNDTFRLLDVVSPHDPNDDWYFSTMKMQRDYEINIDDNKVLQEWFVWINALLGGAEQTLGLTGLGMNLSEVISELIQDDSGGFESEIFLVDTEGIIRLAKSPKYLNLALADFMSDTVLSEIKRVDQLDDDFAIGHYIDQGKEQEIFDIAYKAIENTSWKLIVQIPRSESLKFTRAIVANTIVACIAIILIMVGLFYWLSRRIANPYKRALLLNRELEQKVEERTRELKETNNRIQDSIDYAEMIQRSILPAQSEMQRILKDYFVIYEPRDKVGGDFYWVREYGDEFLVVVGDCTGHGVPGALMATAINSMLNHLVDQINLSDPARILRELYTLIDRSFNADKEEKHVSYGLDAGALYVSQAHGLRFAGSGVSLFVTAEEGVTEMKGRRESLLVKSSRGATIVNQELGYEASRTLVLCTDGVTDQPGGEKSLPYGKQKIMASLLEGQHLPMDQLARLILNGFSLYTSGEEKRDDITLVGIRLK